MNGTILSVSRLSHRLRRPRKSLSQKKPRMAGMTTIAARSAAVNGAVKLAMSEKSSHELSFIVQP
jgi:hypothetical protein